MLVIYLQKMNIPRVDIKRFLVRKEVWFLFSHIEQKFQSYTRAFYSVRMRKKFFKHKYSGINMHQFGFSKKILQTWKKSPNFFYFAPEKAKR